KIFGHVFRKQNVSGVSAIHDSLSQVNSRARDGGLIIYIENGAHRPAMHTHSQGQIGMRFQSTANLQGAFNRFLRTSVEDQRHAIARGAFNQSASRIRLSESLRTLDNLVQPITQSALLINRK